MEPRSGDAAARRPRRRRNRKKLDAEVEGDAFLLQVSVILCACAALAWSLLQVILYQGDEPAPALRFAASGRTGATYWASSAGKRRWGTRRARAVGW